MAGINTAGAGTEAVEHPFLEDTFDESTSSARTADAEADFAPLAEPEESLEERKRDADPFQADSLEAQQAFEDAQEAEKSGSEEQAIQHYIRAAKIAETAREWYLAALACERVGDFLLTPPPPCDLERA